MGSLEGHHGVSDAVHEVPTLLDNKMLALTLILGAGLLAGYVYGTQDAEKKMRKPPVLTNDNDHADIMMTFVVRTDIPMTKGKAAAQCSHAALACYEKGVKFAVRLVKEWRAQGQIKQVLAADSLQQLEKVHRDAVNRGLITQLIQDAGRTQVEPGTVTVLGIGPAPVGDLDKITLDLSLF